MVWLILSIILILSWHFVMQSKQSTAFLRAAQWHNHVNAVRASVQMRDWLTNRASLTARLVARCRQFRVQRLHQGRAICLADEFAEIGLARPLKVIEREVLLRCDGEVMVYAHTVVPMTANATQWPLFAALGEKSLGSTLFSDPLVQRCALSYARLRPGHALMQRIRDLRLLDDDAVSLLARRSVFRRKGACLLVTEVFLPRIASLKDTSGEY
jgi:chorismate--pyruvate lyase